MINIYYDDKYIIYNIIYNDTINNNSNVNENMWQVKTLKFN